MPLMVFRSACSKVYFPFTGEFPGSSVSLWAKASIRLDITSRNGIRQNSLIRPGSVRPTSRNSMYFRANRLRSLLGLAMPITN